MRVACVVAPGHWRGDSIALLRSTSVPQNVHWVVAEVILQLDLIGRNDASDA